MAAAMSMAPSMVQLARQLRGLQAVATRQAASTTTVGEAMDRPTSAKPGTTRPSWNMAQPRVGAIDGASTTRPSQR